MARATLPKQQPPLGCRGPADSEARRDSFRPVNLTIEDPLRPVVAHDPGSMPTIGTGAAAPSVSANEPSALTCNGPSDERANQAARRISTTGRYRRPARYRAIRNLSRARFDTRAGENDGALRRASSIFGRDAQTEGLTSPTAPAPPFASAVRPPCASSCEVARRDARTRRPRHRWLPSSPFARPARCPTPDEAVRIDNERRSREGTAQGAPARTG